MEKFVPFEAGSQEPGARRTVILMWILKVATEGLPEKTFRILPGNVRTLGRSTGADFIVDAALVIRGSTAGCAPCSTAGSRCRTSRAPTEPM